MTDKDSRVILDAVMSEPTPRPWRMDDEHPGSGWVIWNPTRDYAIAWSYTDTTQDEVNVEHIVKCVNAHDELVAALEAVQWTHYARDHEWGCHACGRLRQVGHAKDCIVGRALARARGEEPRSRAYG